MPKHTTVFSEKLNAQKNDTQVNWDKMRKMETAVDEESREIFSQFKML